MVYILALGTILIGILSFLLNKKHILNPSCIVCCVFLISSLFAIYSKNDWQYQLHGITVYVILTSLLVFLLGSILGTQISDKHVLEKKDRFHNINIPSVFLIVSITLFLLLLSYMHFCTILNIGIEMGADVHDFGDVIKKAREGMLHNGYMTTRIDSYSTYFCRGIAYVCIYIFIYDKLIHKNKLRKHSYLLLPMFPLSIKMVLSTGRTQFIYLIVYLVEVYGVLYFQSQGITIQTFFKMIGIGIFSLLSFFVVFSILQIMREGNGRDIIDVISFYTGMSIPSLDDFLVNGRPESNLIGNNTLFPIYDVLRKLGFPLPKLYAPYDFVCFNGTNGNVYTALRRYIEDYTIFGNYVILTFLGTLSSYFYNFVYKQRNRHLALIIYAAFIYPVFEISIEERFFMNIVGTGTLYNLIALYISYVILIKIRITSCNRLK